LQVRLYSKEMTTGDLYFTDFTSRTKDMRSSEKAQWDALKDIVENVKTIPVVANGDVFEYEDIQKLKDHTSKYYKLIERLEWCSI
jgi:hypothetical protein